MMEQLQRRTVAAAVTIGCLVWGLSMATGQDLVAPDPSEPASTVRVVADRGALLADAPPIGQMTALNAEVLDSIIFLLSGYEFFPSAEDLVALAENPVPYLLAIAYDVDGNWIPMHHHRAIGALSYFPSPEVEAHLGYLLESANTPDLMRHHVINALANGFGDDALEQLTPLLYSEDLQLQLTAVSAIGTIETPASVNVLESILTEPIVQDLVRQRVEQQLSTQPVIRPPVY